MAMVSERDVGLVDGRLVRVYDTGATGGAGASDALTVLWHHGSPQTGRLLAPLVAAAAARGIRLLSYGRPSYGGSSPHPGRDVASAAADVAQIVDALAFVAPWGFDVARIDAPVLLVHGGQDRVVPPAHADWLVRTCPAAELWLRPRDGHISVLDASPVAIDWLRAHAGPL